MKTGGSVWKKSSRRDFGLFRNVPTIIGRRWNQLSDKEKQSLSICFRTLLTNTYADRVETYSGEGVQYLNERTRKNMRSAHKVLSGKTEIPMDYRLLNKSNDWHVYDVVVDGVSLVNNYRGQFTKILHTSSYSDLVDQLRKKSEKIKAPSSLNRKRPFRRAPCSDIIFRRSVFSWRWPDSCS